jgi:hypothetical protein
MEKVLAECVDPGMDTTKLVDGPAVTIGARLGSRQGLVGPPQLGLGIPKCFHPLPHLDGRTVGVGGRGKCSDAEVDAHRDRRLRMPRGAEHALPAGVGAPKGETETVGIATPTGPRTRQSATEPEGRTHRLAA